MPIPLRADFDAPRLRAIAKKTRDGAQVRRHTKHVTRVRQVLRALG